MGPISKRREGKKGKGQGGEKKEGGWEKRGGEKMQSSTVYF